VSNRGPFLLCEHGIDMDKQICHECEPGYERRIDDPWEELSDCDPDTIAAVMGAPLCCEFCGGDHLARYCGNK
jgi:hypothetical protein